MMTQYQVINMEFNQEKLYLHSTVLHKIITSLKMVRAILKIDPSFKELMLIEIRRYWQRQRYKQCYA